MNHNPDQVDGFNLFIKSTVLLSRAKNFNIGTEGAHLLVRLSNNRGLPETRE